MIRFLSEILKKHTKLAKIVQISEIFNRLVFPLNFNRFCHPMTNTSNQLSDEINEQQIMIKFSKNLELIYSGFMKKKLQSGGSFAERINPHCKNNVVKVISELGNETYTISSK